MRCPKCDKTRPVGTTAPDWQCPHCGVAYDKIRAVPPGRPAIVSASPRTSLSDAIFYGLVLSGIMLSIKALYHPLSLIGSLLLVPFFFTVIPVMTRVVLGELWCWDRDKVRFVRFNLEERPLLGNLFTLFFAVTAAIFAYYFFKFDR